MQKTVMTLLVAFAVTAPALTATAEVDSQLKPRSNQFWWPDQLDLSPLRQHAAESNPLGKLCTGGHAS